MGEKNLFPRPAIEAHFDWFKGKIKVVLPNRVPTCQLRYEYLHASAPLVSREDMKFRKPSESQWRLRNGHFL